MRGAGPFPSFDTLGLGATVGGFGSVYDPLGTSPRGGKRLIARGGLSLFLGSVGAPEFDVKDERGGGGGGGGGGPPLAVDCSLLCFLIRDIVSVS